MQNLELTRAETVLALHQEKLKKWFRVTVALVAALIVFSVVSLTSGYVDVRASDVFYGMRKIFAGADLTRGESVLYYIRLPRLITAILVGASLCVSGVVFQGLFRNPLADPYVIGVSSGAAFGATLSLFLGFQTVLPGYSLMLFAFLGAGLSLWIVYRVSLHKGRIVVLHLLLAGVIVGLFFSGMTTLLLLFSRNETKPLLFWILGGVSLTFWHEIVIGAAVVLFGMALVFSRMNHLHAMLLGEDAAACLGADVQKAKKILLVGGALLTAVSVSLGGLVGFVGVIVPHFLRMLAGNDIRYLLLSSVAAGSAFLLGCDLLSRIVPGMEIPLGVITTFFGVPFFLILMLAKKGKYYF